MKKHAVYHYLIILILILFLSTSCNSIRENSDQADIYSFVLYPIEKLRPHYAADPVPRATIRLAKNEYEPVIVGIRNDSDKPIHIREITVETDPLCHVQYDLYQVSYYQVKKKSRWFDSPEKRGLWPDPLIPLKPALHQPDPGKQKQADEDSGVKRFVPVPELIVPPGENRIFLLDVFLPPDAVTQPGRISLSISLTTGASYSTTIVLEPRKFTLPAQPSLTTSVKCRKKDIINLHKRKSYLPFNEDSLFYDYYKLLSRFRLFLYISDDSLLQKQFQQKKGLRDWSEFDNFFSPMLDGTLVPDKKESPVYYFHLRNEKAEEKDVLAGFLAEFTAHLKERGWLEKSVYYIVDEPLYTDYPRIRGKAEFIKKYAPGLRILVTDPFSESLEEVIDIWCVDIPFIGDSIPFLPGFMKRNHPAPEYQLHYPTSKYQERIAMGEEFWMYTCTSAQILDYPNLFIDSEGLYHRIIPWLNYKYKSSGFYYWNATYSYKANPWRNQYFFNANGDGTLVYPCLPGMYGFKNHAVFPSLRMIFLREGMEDYEYLSLAARAAGTEAVHYLCDKIVKSSLNWEHDPAFLQGIRNEIADMIE
ncbi:MAG: DUF4091 domain-containing protein [Spirochaetales bacterium]|nr:DUF4091 domain-containing protein [Spirochaetales bacterium]